MPFVIVDMNRFLVALSLVLLLRLVNLVTLVPLRGALVRLRAHYNPKRLQLHPEGGIQPHTGPVIRSFFAMLARVYRIEGWRGLYRGVMPTLFSASIIDVFVLFLLWTVRDLPRWIYTASLTGALRLLAYNLFFMLISLPGAIIIVRAITTPHKLPYFNAVYALRVLLTPTERRSPWILYLTPGYLTVQGSLIASIVLGRRTVLHLLHPKFNQPGIPVRESISAHRWAMFIVFALASTVVITPLEVIAIRLAIQHNHEINSASQEEGNTEGTLEYSGIDEDVINLRTEQEPYTGVVDCAKRIIEEERWSALYRGWWLTTLGCLVGIYSG